MDGFDENRESSLFDDEMLRELLDFEVDSEAMLHLPQPVSPMSPRPSPQPKSRHLKVSHKAANLQEKRLIPTPKRSNTSGLQVEERLNLMGKEDLVEAKELEEVLSTCSIAAKKEAVREIKSRVAAIEESLSLAKSVLNRLMTQTK